MTGNGKTEGIGMKEANDEMRRTIRQERSNVLVEVAHLDTKEAVAVLIAAINERALESGLVSEVRFRPLVAGYLLKGMTVPLRKQKNQSKIDF